jgi:hypothetical protein
MANAFRFERFAVYPSAAGTLPAALVEFYTGNTLGIHSIL